MINSAMAVNSIFFNLKDSKDVVMNNSHKIAQDYIEKLTYKFEMKSKQLLCLLNF